MTSCAWPSPARLSQPDRSAIRALTHPARDCLGKRERNCKIRAQPPASGITGPLIGRSESAISAHAGPPSPITLRVRTSRNLTNRSRSARPAGGAGAAHYGAQMRVICALLRWRSSLIRGAGGCSSQASHGTNPGREGRVVPLLWRVCPVCGLSGCGCAGSWEGRFQGAGPAVRASGWPGLPSGPHRFAGRPLVG